MGGRGRVKEKGREQETRRRRRRRRRRRERKRLRFQHKADSTSFQREKSKERQTAFGLRITYILLRGRREHLILHVVNLDSVALTRPTGTTDPPPASRFHALPHALSYCVLPVNKTCLGETDPPTSGAP